MSRLSGLIVRGFRHAQRLFHVLVGLAFMFLALGGASVSVKLWADYRKTPSEGLLVFWMVAGFTVFLVVLSLYSFLKARSVRSEP